MAEKNGFFGPQTVQRPGKPVVFRGVGFDLMKVNGRQHFQAKHALGLDPGVDTGSRPRERVKQKKP